MRILGIETSCDETSVALLQVDGKTVRLKHHETSTQIPIHERYGGVVPEVAARTHVAELISLLDRAGVFKKKKSFDAIAVTRGPGLATALRVGIEAAKTLSYTLDLPIIGVNHLEGHLASAWLLSENRKRWKFPVLALLVSGGHSELVFMRDFCNYKVIGRSRDDAAGEAFDKTAKLMGLGYPGGPKISKMAAEAPADTPVFDLPRPMINDPSFDFSFSGFKTAVRRVWEDLPTNKKKESKTIKGLCRSIEQAIVDILVKKTVIAARRFKPKALVIVGGVSANSELQKKMSLAVRKELKGVIYLAPPKGFYTDNAAMVAAAGAWRFKKDKRGYNWKKMDAEPELDL
ncbi:MAG: tRNA (adenosine(37)-N6)-threonylcarbamoyltransferase complex transferase subunit TsaD [Patescibacteria group bacterium]